MKAQEQLKLRVVPADSGFWLDAILDDQIMKHLWKCIRKAKKDAINCKQNLAGNLSESYQLIDIDNIFTQNAIKPLVNEYINESGVSFGSKLELSGLWVNFQNKHEFNPQHNHNGTYSFVIWMKIPYTFEEECKQSFLDGVNHNDIRVGCFEFQYTNMLGHIVSTTYAMSPEVEGHMLLFPSALKHQVYPFYTSDEQRVSISGNIWATDQYGREYNPDAGM